MTFHMYRPCRNEGQIAETLFADGVNSLSGSIHRLVVRSKVMSLQIILNIIAVINATYTDHNGAVNAK